MHSNNLNKDAGFKLNDTNFDWQSGMSSVATDNGQNTNFAENWNTYQYINYSIQNESSVLSQDLNDFNQMIYNHNSSGAVMYYCFVLGQQLSNGTADDENKVSDQVTDVSNVSNAISALKTLFNSADGLTNPAEIQQVNADFKNGLNSLSSYVSSDEWLSEIASAFNSNTQGAIPEMQNALAAVDGNLNEIWPNLSTISPSAFNQSGLQAMLTGFDTMESATTTIGTQNEEVLQYYSGLYQQMATVLGTSQNEEVQAINSINNNIPKSNQ